MIGSAVSLPFCLQHMVFEFAVCLIGVATEKSRVGSKLTNAIGLETEKKKSSRGFKNSTLLRLSWILFIIVMIFFVNILKTLLNDNCRSFLFLFSSEVQCVLTTACSRFHTIDRSVYGLMRRTDFTFNRYIYNVHCAVV